MQPDLAERRKLSWRAWLSLNGHSYDIGLSVAVVTGR